MANASGGLFLGDEDIKLMATGIRADVLQAVRKVWPQFKRQAVLTLGTQNRAAKFIEAAALSLSHQLDQEKQKAALLNKTVVSMLEAHLDLALSKGKGPSKKRIAGAKGEHADSPDAPAADFAALFPKLDDETSMVVAMRSWGHNWKETAAMLGISPSKARSLFLRSMRTVFPQPSDRKRSAGKKGSIRILELLGR